MWVQFILRLFLYCHNSNNNRGKLKSLTFSKISKQPLVSCVIYVFINHHHNCRYLKSLICLCRFHNVVCLIFVDHSDFRNKRNYLSNVHKTLAIKKLSLIESFNNNFIKNQIKIHIKIKMFEIKKNQVLKSRSWKKEKSKFIICNLRVINCDLFKCLWICIWIFIKVTTEY